MSRPRYILSISASQLEDYWHRDKDYCKRRWYLDKGVRRLPTIQQHGAAFGDVAHAVVARWLKADDRGVDIVSGEALELYPKGWEQAVDRFGQKGDFLSIQEAGILQQLVKQAVEEGYLYRIPNRKVEEYFEFFLETDEGLVKLSGYIDLRAVEGRHGEVWDIKTHRKSTSAKSANGIRNSVQMILYAIALYLENDRQLDDVLLRHVAFIRNPKDVKIHKRRGADPSYTAAEIEALIVELRGVCAEMIRTSRIENHLEVPGPPEKSRACMKYNGCHFKDLCRKHNPETIEQYKARTIKAIESIQSRDQMALTSGIKTGSFLGMPIRPATLLLNAQQTKGTLFMPAPSIFEKKLAAQQAVNGAASAPAAPPPKPLLAAPKPAAAAAPAAKAPSPVAPKPVTTMAKPVKPVAPAVPARETPPWATPNCQACGGSGFNTEGRTCRICDINAPKRGVLPSSAYVIVPDGNGGAIWELKQAGAPAPEPQVASPALAPQVEAIEQAETEASEVDTSGASDEQEPEESDADGEGEAEDAQEADDPKEVQQEDPQGASAETAEQARTEAEESQDQTEAPATADQPKGRGRPKGSKNKPKAPQEVQVPIAIAAQALDSEAPSTFVIPLPVGFDFNKRKGLTIIVNAYYQHLSPEGLGPIKSLDSIFGHFSSLLAAREGVPSYYHVSAAKRRDAMASIVREVAAHFDGGVILGRCDSPDMMAFVAALRPWATVFIEGNG